MNTKTLAALCVPFTQGAAENRIRPETALRPDIAGMRIYDPPLVAVGSATDPLFELLRTPGIIGPHFVPPQGLLAGARSVIAFFLPFSDAVTKANRVHPVDPAPEWLHACNDGKAMVAALAAHLAETLRREGHEAVVPGADATGAAGWSERHVAFVCGLGTFGLSAGLITAKGIAGTFGSVITNLPLEPNTRPYAGHMDYCTHCGECAKRCPVAAISPERGKDHTLCRAQSNLGGRYGCGKCQVGVPCAKGVPAPSPSA